MDRTACTQALKAKDPRFDGRFFVGVRTTGIYCRPVCPVKSPKLVNVEFFPTAAAAAEAGFRPCLRCRPESSPGTPAWAGTSTTVIRGLRLIGEGALDGGSVAALSERLGVTPRHLSRLFMQHLGASPKAVAQTRRLHFAKKLLDETRLSMTEIALSAGYGSVRRFNDHLQQVYGRAPSALRGRQSGPSASAVELRLPYRPPYDFAALLDFLRRRATPGVEFVEGDRYRRHILVDGERGVLVVERASEGHALRCSIELPASRSLMAVVERVRRLFDLNADPLEIRRCLARDPRLAGSLKRRPGLRVPGAWDPFELAVRAIVGQQVSVAGATTVMGKIAQRFGTPADGALWFPTPESMAAAPLEDLPMPRSRGAALRDLARAVRDGAIAWTTDEPARLRSQLLAIKGVGPWTAQYVAMRAANDPDAFLDTDLVLQQVAAERFGAVTRSDLARWSEAWRPWRAYAAMHLWAMAH